MMSCRFSNAAVRDRWQSFSAACPAVWSVTVLFMSPRGIPARPGALAQQPHAWPSLRLRLDQLVAARAVAWQAPATAQAAARPAAPRAAGVDDRICRFG